MATTLGNLKRTSKRLVKLALLLPLVLALVHTETVAQEEGSLPRYATWRIGDFGDVPSPTNGVYRIEYSPDGRYLASRSKDNVVVVYDLKTRLAVCKVEGHERWIETIDFSPSGEFFVTASGKGDKVKIWETQTGTLRSEIDAGGSKAFFDETGKLINILGETHVRSYSWPGVQLTQSRKWKVSRETAKAMSRDGRYVVVFRSLNKVFITTVVDTELQSRVPLADRCDL